MSSKSRGNFPHYPNPEQCCERCVFGTGEHSDWCPQVRWQRSQPTPAKIPGVGDYHTPGCAYLFGLSCNCYVEPKPEYRPQDCGVIGDGLQPGKLREFN